MATWIIDPVEARAVVATFAMKARGDSHSKIAAELNAANNIEALLADPSFLALSKDEQRARLKHPPRKSLRWNASSIGNIINHERLYREGYLECTYGDEKVGGLDAGLIIIGRDSLWGGSRPEERGRRQEPDADERGNHGEQTGHNLAALGQDPPADNWLPDRMKRKPATDTASLTERMLKQTNRIRRGMGLPPLEARNGKAKGEKRVRRTGPRRTR